jgi:hypothetical protein
MHKYRKTTKKSNYDGSCNVTSFPFHEFQHLSRLIFVSMSVKKSYNYVLNVKLINIQIKEQSAALCAPSKL